MQRPHATETEAPQTTKVTLTGSSVSPWLLAVLATCLFAALGWWFFLRGHEVRVVVPVRGDAAEVVYATGIVEPVHWAKVAALQRKRIIEICRCEGRAVKLGEVLVRLDDDEERAGLTEIEARLQRFRDDAERLRQLVERSVTARTLLDDKLTQVREYEAKVEAQKERIDLLKLKAPMDGVVLRRDGEVGEIAGVAASDVLLWVGQPRPLRVVAEVNEDDIGRVKMGQNVLLRHEGGADRPLVATVDSITPKGDPQTKTFRAYLALPDVTPLQIGMSVEANIVVAEAKGALLLPAEAVLDNQVQVIENGRAVRRDVVIGIRGTRLVENRSGVTAEDLVVSPFRSELANGVRVRPAPATAGGTK
jgi:RND family efflux transporter MFP subunit